MILINISLHTLIFFSVKGTPCGNNCQCHYNLIHRTNIFTCNGPQYTELPATVPDFTQWIYFENTQMSQLCGSYPYLARPQNMSSNTITSLSLKPGKINHVCDNTLHDILHYSTMESLNLAWNNLQQIPIIFNVTIGNLNKLWLGGNPIKCNCDMLWLISWLNSTMISGRRLVQDYQDVICSGGRLDGIPVYKLTRVQMGCYPKPVATWTIVLSGVIGGLALLSVIAALMIHRKWNAVRWLVYQRFDKLLGNPDRNENLENTEFDAFLSYW